MRFDKACFLPVNTKGVAERQTVQFLCAHFHLPRWRWLPFRHACASSEAPRWLQWRTPVQLLAVINRRSKLLIPKPELRERWRALSLFFPPNYGDGRAWAD